MTKEQERRLSFLEVQNVLNLSLPVMLFDYLGQGGKLTDSIQQLQDWHSARKKTIFDNHERLLKEGQ